jgi:uncharacterized protein YecE (DUF72 family)
VATTEERLTSSSCRALWEDLDGKHHAQLGNVLFQTLQALRPEKKQSFFSKGAWDLKGMSLRLQEAIDEPTGDLRLAPDRHIHVGLMDYMGEAHEGYRKELDFLETTNTWFDTDSPDRKGVNWLPDECGWQDVTRYHELSARVNDGFHLVLKVSHVATHLCELQNPEEWWPRLWEQKYSQLANGTVALLWQFAPRFKHNPETMERLKGLFNYFAVNPQWKNLKHIVDFRNKSWFNQKVYEVLRKHNVCLAWLHLRNTGWACDLSNGWTPTVKTSDFTFIRLFGNEDRCTGWYDKGFLHKLFDMCPKGMHSYVLFGNKSTFVDPDPIEKPCFLNARDFRKIFSRMDLVDRVRDLRYESNCPRQLTQSDAWAVTSFFVRYSEKGRRAGITMSTPVFVVDSEKFYKNAKGKRSYEWRFADGREIHLSLHDANEEQDLMGTVRQLTGMEDVNTVEKICSEGPRQLSSSEVAVVNSTFIRFSHRARQAGVLRTTPVRLVSLDGQLGFTWLPSTNSPGETCNSAMKTKITSEAKSKNAVTLSTHDLRTDMAQGTDIWTIYCDLRNGVPPDSVAGA